MSLQTTNSLLGQGGAHLNDQAGAAIRELQGLNVSIVTGATASTKMDIAGIRLEDTVVSAIASAAGVLTDVTGNISISATAASGTITLSGQPSNDETLVVNGATYTFKTTPTGLGHVLIDTTFALTTDRLALAINAYEKRYNEGWNTPAVLAVSNGVDTVTVTSVIDGEGNGPVVTDVGTTITVAGPVEAKTATFVGAGNTDALVVNGVTFTVVTAVTVGQELVEMEVAADDTAQALAAAKLVNTYEAASGSLGAVATASGTVVTIVPRDARSGNIITLSEAATNVAVSGSGYLAGGSNTGGVVSDADLSTSGAGGVIVTWFNKS